MHLRPIQHAVDAASRQQATKIASERCVSDPSTKLRVAARKECPHQKSWLHGVRASRAVLTRLRQMQHANESPGPSSRSSASSSSVLDEAASASTDLERNGCCCKQRFRVHLATASDRGAIAGLAHLKLVLRCIRLLPLEPFAFTPRFFAVGIALYRE